jgi:hypothetical protein
MLLALVCILYGEVDLNIIHKDSVEGYIGNREVTLTKYNDYIYGEIEGKEIALNVSEKGEVVGLIGNQHVQWAITGNHISGFQGCL